MEWVLKILTIAWKWFDWQAVGAIGTFLAVIVALLPIWIDCRRKRVQAKNFRLRLGSKLLLLRPYLVAVAYNKPPPGRPLSAEEFRGVATEMEIMMSQSSVLEADEHDLLGATVAKLVLLTPRYHYEEDKPATKSIVEDIDSTIRSFEKHGFKRMDEDALLDEKTKF